MPIVTSMTELIGHTPLFEPRRYAERHKLVGRLLLKLENLNPLGTTKVRVAQAMLDEALACGRLRPGGTVIEATSGSMGVGLAFACAARGCKAVLTMPDAVNPERLQLLRALGAQVVLTPVHEGMQGAIRRADELAAQTEGSFQPDQFRNPENPAVHRRTTGEEIWEQTNGQVDIFVAGVGTGGTLTGIGEALKAHDSSVQIMAVEPTDSPVLAGGRPAAHKLQGIGAGFTPPLLDCSLYEEVLHVRTDEAYAACRDMATQEGLLIGVSGGAAVHAAMTLARRAENRGKTIVTVIPDTGERYLDKS
ncbi:MAG: cysteine synthase A [Acutalibacteraceae bacterium]